MSIQTELTRITNAKTAIKTAIEGKGVTVPSGTKLDGMAALIEAIQAGGGGTSVEDGLIDGTITECINNRVTNVRIYAFQGLKKLAKVDLPAATKINDYAFNGCNAMTTVNLPAATSIGNSAFNGCTALTTVNLPAATSIGNNACSACTALTTVNLPAATKINDYAFNGCNAMTKVDLYAATSIGKRAFYNCKKLKSIIIRSETMCTLSDTDAFTNTPGTSHIYVPSALLESYRAATNWSNYAARFRAIEDYPGI